MSSRLTPDWTWTPTEWLLHPVGAVDLPYGPDGADMIRVSIDNEGAGAFVVVRGGKGEVRVNTDEVLGLVRLLTYARQVIEVAQSTNGGGPHAG